MSTSAEQWDGYVQTYEGARYLEHAEQRLLRLYRERWSRTSMLDIGVGAGRTTFTFGAVAGHYVGIDFSPQMVKAAQRFVAEDEHLSLRVGDARRLTDLGSTFDVVLFSYNGIDSLGREDRSEALAQMRAVLKPGGHVLFSTHSLHGLRDWIRLSPPGRSPQSVYRWFIRLPAALRLARVGRALDIDELMQRGWARLPVALDHADLEHGYVTIDEQRRQLEQAGLAEVEIIDMAGRVVDPASPPSDHFLHWLCRART